MEENVTTDVLFSQTESPNISSDDNSQNDEVVDIVKLDADVDKDSVDVDLEGDGLDTAASAYHGGGRGYGGRGWGGRGWGGRGWGGRGYGGRGWGGRYYGGWGYRPIVYGKKMKKKTLF